MAIQIMVYSYHEILLSNIKGMNYWYYESQKHYEELKKEDKKEYTVWFQF